MRTAVRFIFIAAVVAFATPAVADDASDFCFFSKPQASCLVFPLTEMRVTTRVSARDPASDQPMLVFGWEYGLMRNVTSADAFGGTLYLRSDDYSGGLQWGVKLRYRRWLNPSLALDVAPGIVPSLRGYTEFTGTIGVTYRDWIGLDLQMETFPTVPFGGTQASVFVGIRVGGLPGSIAGALSLTGLALVYGNLSGD